MDGIVMILNCLILVVLLIPFALSSDIINTSISISGNDVVVSKEGKFALGFFSPGSSGNRYLGIWYYKIPGQTVLWVANRNNPINDSSGVLLMSADGNLVLHDGHGGGIPLWSTNVSAKGAYGCVAQLLDSGNLVLVQNGNKQIIWQSFDYPTDTSVPGMKLGFDQKAGLNWFLTSWKSADDPGTGEWSYKLNPTGCPQFFLYKGTTPYYRSSPWPWESSLVGDRVLSVYNKDQIYSSLILDDGSILTRFVVNSTGLIQLLTWDNSSNQWMLSRSEPKYTYGHCGAYGIVNANSMYSLDCMCLPGYEPKSLQNWNLRDGSGGCVRKETMSMCRNGEGFVKVEGVKVPDTSIATLMNTSFNIFECEQLCMSNCSCNAYASLDIDRKGVGCLAWFGDLMDTIQITGGSDLYVRVDSIELGILLF